MSDLLVDLSAITKDYRGLRPLRIERLDIAAGERIALVGLDQIAAEVLVNLLTGATVPDTGEVRVFGRPTTAIANAEEWLATADRFGIVSERAVLLESMTVLQNLAMPFSLDVEPPAPDVAARAVKLADVVGLSASVLATRTVDLDPSRRVLVRFARALALDPAVVVLEHPTQHVSRDAAPALADEIRTAAERHGAAVLVLTADETFARRVASRVLRHDPATGRLRPLRTGWFG